MLGRAAHTQETGVDLLDESQKEARQDVEQQQVHEVSEENLGAVSRRIVVEKTVEDGAPEVEWAFDADAALDGAHHNQEEPPEGDTAVHIAESPVLLGDAQVQQALAEHLPDGGQYLGGKHVFTDDGLLFAVELANPADELVAADGKQGDGPQHERKYERMIVSHSLESFVRGGLTVGAY